MNQRVEGQYFVLRYMFDELREEAANIGIVLATAEPAHIRFRFLGDLSAKSRADVRIDPRLVKTFCDWFERRIAGARYSSDPQGMLNSLERELREHTGNIIRVMGPRGILLEDVDLELQVLYDEWVAPRKQRTPEDEIRIRDPLGGLRRQARSEIIRALRQSITTPEVRRVVRKDFELRGKVHINRFDAAFVPPKRGSITRVFHHVLVLPEAEDTYDQAAALARRWLDVAERGGNHRTLTAVFYSRSNPETAALPEAAALLKHDEIHVASVQQLRDVANSLEPQGRLWSTTSAPRRRTRPRL